MGGFEVLNVSGVLDAGEHHVEVFLADEDCVVVFVFAPVEVELVDHVPAVDDVAECDCVCFHFVVVGRAWFGFPSRM